MKKTNDLPRTVHDSFCLTKILMIMKLTSLLLIFTLLQVMAKGTYSQTTRLSMTLGETTIEEVLKKIEDKSEFYFLFNQKMVDVNRIVNVDAENEKIEEILADIFIGTDVDYFIMDRQIILSPKQYLAAAKSKFQPETVTGNVTDENGEPLVGLTIYVKGTTAGTITDVEGNYTISISPGMADPVLVFSYVGMSTKEVRVGDQRTINTMMSEDMIGLEEVVAIGYGTKSKLSLTGSITEVKSEVISRKIATNVMSNIMGTLPGMWSPGPPAAQATRVTISKSGAYPR